MKVITKQNILDYLKARKKIFYNSFGIVSIGVFGSIIKGDYNEKSDIDIVINFAEGKKNIHNFLKFRRLLEKELGRNIDLGVETSIKEIVKKEIKKDIIYV